VCDEGVGFCAEPFSQSERALSREWWWWWGSSLVRFKKQPLDLTLRVIRKFIPVDGKVLLDYAVRVSLTGFDLST
jgi:hypothetical protein